MFMFVRRKIADVPHVEEIAKDVTCLHVQLTLQISDIYSD